MISLVYLLPSMKSVADYYYLAVSSASYWNNLIFPVFIAKRNSIFKQCVLIWFTYENVDVRFEKEQWKFIQVYLNERDSRRLVFLFYYSSSSSFVSWLSGRLSHSSRHFPPSCRRICVCVERAVDVNTCDFSRVIVPYLFSLCRALRTPPTDHEISDSLLLFRRFARWVVRVSPRRHDSARRRSSI
jgi:hypothetical protein